VAARQWRVVTGAATAVATQLAVGWAVAGSQTMMRYAAELWLLARDPRLIARHASELHSVRGFVTLLVPYPAIVTACSLIALVAAMALAVRTWLSPAPLAVRFGVLIVLTILGSPHLISYDLLLLTLPLLLFADWAVRNADHRFRSPVSASLVLLYFAPFSGMIVARLTGVQVSVIVMAMLTWWMYQVSTASRAIVAPRWDAASSQNSTTAGWRSSVA